MNCEQVKEHLSAYLDNMLAEDEVAQVETHTKVCPGCSSVLADVGYFDALLANLPRIAPDESVREKLFSSAAYRELTGTYGRTPLNGHPAPRQPLRRPDRPLLVALPGGRSTEGCDSIAIVPRSSLKRRVPVQLRILRLLIAASFLLTLGVGSFIGWQWRQKADHGSPTISATTPPSWPAQGPIPAGIRFVFLRGGSLWSAPSDGGTGIMRMTPTSTVVADNWTIRPALPGRPAGNMLAYIDIQRGFVHIIRSDGQNDIAIPQPLLKRGTIPTSVWDTKTGAIILNSLSWSKDGSMLAFVTEDGNMDQTRLYIYTVNTHSVSAVTLPVKGEIADPTWSPDSIRVAFTCTHDGRASILDYNTRNHGVLTIASVVNTAAHPNESILTLDWSPSSIVPTLTWSVGTIGQIHSIWLQRVGAASELAPRALTLGNYVQAIYSQAGNGGIGSWLLIGTRSGLPGDIETVDLAGNRHHLTDDKRISLAQWSPNGEHINYLEKVSSGLGVLHVVDCNNGADTLLTTNVTTLPLPAWSPDSQALAFSTDSHIMVSMIQAIATAQPLKLAAPASALSWSVGAANQLVLATNDGQLGLYLANIQADTIIQLDKENVQGPIVWTQIP